MSDPRRAAHEALAALFDQGRSYADSLDDQSLSALTPRDRALARALAYGAARHWRLLATLLDGLLDRPLKPRDQGLRYWLVLGLLQLGWMRIPAHAAVNETVRRVPRWARGLSNAVLRRYLREGAPTDLPAAPAAIRHAVPDWLAEQLADDWPDQLDTVLAAGNQAAPMWLRVDGRKIAPADYVQALTAARLAVADHHGTAIRLQEPVDVARLPGWNDGQVHVQDRAAQQAAALLTPRDGERILDACAAPGGKSLHLLALAEIDLTCVDSVEARAQRIHDGLARSGDEARVVVADAAVPADWWDGRPFDAILLDAPCSGTGVIRRHPDIKWLRRERDIPTLVDQQRRLLEACWEMLAPGGRLLYTTCSILRAENAEVADAFLASRSDAQPVPLNLDAGRADGPGWQVLPGEADQDGFFYAMMARR